MQNKQYTITVTENAPLMEYLTKNLVIIAEHHYVH